MRRKGRPRAAKPRHGDLAALAKRQHGVVSGRQLRALGYSPSAIERAAAAGRLHRLHRGVYAVGHTALSWHGRCLAAVLASGPGALASHVSAGRLWGILESRSGALHITAPTRRRARSAFRLHHACLSEADRAVVDGIPVTALPRTLLDLAAICSSRRLERAIERAERLQLFDLTAIETLLAHVKGHQGTGRLRRAVASYRPEPVFTRSPLEQRFLDLVRDAGLPPPSMNCFVNGYELDAYWPRERFAVELDGYEFHRTRAAFERDRLRQEELQVAGIEVIRVTHRRIAREPRQLADHLATFLQRRRDE